MRAFMMSLILVLSISNVNAVSMDDLKKLWNTVSPTVSMYSCIKKYGQRKCLHMECVKIDFKHPSCQQFLGQNVQRRQTQNRTWYGAIAYSPSSRIHGYSYNYQNRYDAENKAMIQCKNYSRRYDCRVLVVFRNGCGALAQGSIGYGSGWGANKYSAEMNALYSCRRVSNNCRVVRWVCTK